jgi:hypothetical protein
VFTGKRLASGGQDPARPGQPPVPMAMALLARLGALLWAALRWHGTSLA